LPNFKLGRAVAVSEGAAAEVHFDMRARIRQVARHADFPEEGIVHPQPAPSR
jgi:hypothetical protein